MNKEELIKKLEDIEWEDFEVKEAKSDVPKNASETVSAFSNTSGGWVYCYKNKPVVQNEIDYYKITFGLELNEKYSSAGEKAAKGYTRTIPETTQKLPRNYPETAQKIYDLIIANPKITRKELAEKVGLSEDGIKFNLNKLKKDGLLKRVGPDKGGHWEIIKRKD